MWHGERISKVCNQQIITTGNLADGTTTNRLKPVYSVKGAISAAIITTVEVGYQHGLVIAGTGTGNVFGWGYNGYGSIGGTKILKY